MTTITNNEEVRIQSGRYAAKITGALDLQWDIGGTGFTTIDDGSFAAASSKIIELPMCYLKVINAGSNKIVLRQIIDKVK